LSFPFAETGLARVGPTERNHDREKKRAAQEKMRKDADSKTRCFDEKTDNVFIFEDNPSLPRIWLP